jgi:hypothetical protein
MMEAELYERLVAHRVALVCLVKMLELRRTLKPGELGYVLKEFSDDPRSGMDKEITVIVESVDTDLGWTPTIVAGGKN